VATERLLLAKMTLRHNARKRENGQDYSDATACLNLLYRQKADMDVDPADREKDMRIADDLVDQAKAIMAKKSLSKPAAVNFLRVLFVADGGAEFTLGYAH
jgi:hypothetical protein